MIFLTGIFRGIQELIGNFRSIIDFIKTAWGFVVSLIKSVGDLINLISSIFTIVSNFILTLPSWLIAFATLSISVSILFLILGRGKTN